METEFLQNEEMICVVCDRLLGGGYMLRVR